ncbi:glycosyltransferase family 4 protein [Aureimonas jatrophae]|uniref:Glycosyltransferase involved in cell wall bisynthesis n=1 Tax=Aureimonas jatrophae TaxID=1166073 RepID=A0A1H0EVX0_9HYPH|nr:glycosyltransferase family 4 protein [Aureimonas jatrophae]MBB3950290.1 glycosyltransferase involved in cell wall biosynthesis [Aureimonas jatrophae]SDN86512.1 Glycosyltransferase involved in cell wall bisynthesis [Aureimonas jatrophae]
MRAETDATLPAPPVRRLPIVVKGYPRLSETFIAQEILALEQAGFAVEIWSLREPTDGTLHELHRRIRAPVRYLPEYLYRAPLRVLRGLLHACRLPGRGALLRAALRDVRRDPTPNRMRRLGQALVLARELDPALVHIYVHFLHTPASVARYAALLRGGTFSFSAHAKDIWTTTDWEKREKIAASRFGVTCTREGFEELRRLSPADDPERVRLAYHGLDLDRFPAPPERASGRDGRDPADPVRIVTVGRMVAKKGFGDLLDALARLPSDQHWRLVHIGSGELKAALKAQADRLGLRDRIEWRGSQPQDAVIAALREADLFVLACREGDAGDRDGLPNVLMEAASQRLAIVSTRYAGVPEFVTDGENGRLVSPADPAALARALRETIADPALREHLGRAAFERLQRDFSLDTGIATLTRLLDESLTALPPVRP